MELLTILLLLVFLLEEGLRLGLLGLKFLNKWRKTMKQVRKDRVETRSLSHHPACRSALGGSYVFLV